MKPQKKVPKNKHHTKSTTVGSIGMRTVRKYRDDTRTLRKHTLSNEVRKSSKGNIDTALKTSWGKEAEWYADHLEQEDTYHAKVILPNLERIINPTKGMKILEVGGGEGFVARVLSRAGAHVTVSDISAELIASGIEKGGGVTYRVSKAEDLSWVQRESYDVILAVLTLQNMEKIEPVIAEIAKVLRTRGRFIFVLNHPVFRIPKATMWGYDEDKKVQYRRVDGYLSARSEKLDMHPGKRSKSFTYSYHRSLQDYMKALRGAGMAITRLEEWISHKTSEKGPRAGAENTARKEFPLFMMVETLKM